MATIVDRPLVSVALCTWNGARWLPALLQSIADQDQRPDELVVQDDASDDDTVAILRRFAEEVDFDVSVEVNPTRIGSTPNFERALNRCGGEIVALADQDDLWYPTKLATLVDVLEADPILTLVFSDADLVDEQGTPTGERLWDSRRIGRYLRRHEVVPGSMFARRALSTGCTMAVRRRAVEASLPFPDTLDHCTSPMRHDRWLSLAAASVGTVRAVPDALLAFRVHPAQQTGVLTGPQLTARLAHVAFDAVRGRRATQSEEHQVRVRQIGEAALRADRLGDFEDADALRRVAAHHEARSQLGPNVARRMATIGREVATGGYSRSVAGAASAAADIARALRPQPPHPPS